MHVHVSILNCALFSSQQGKNHFKLKDVSHQRVFLRFFLFENFLNAIVIEPGKRIYEGK